MIAQTIHFKTSERPNNEEAIILKESTSPTIGLSIPNPGVPKDIFGTIFRVPNMGQWTPLDTIGR